MSDFQLLLLILAALYLSESLFWVRRGTVVLRSFFSRRMHVAHPSPGFGSTGVGVVMLNPVPPLGRAFLCHQWPLSITPEAVCSFVPNVINTNDRPTHLGYHVRFADIQKVACEAAVIMVNDHPFARLNSESLAEHFATLLRKLRALPEEKRSAAIDAALRAATSTSLVRRRLKRYRREAKKLPLYTHLVFFVLFGPVVMSFGLMPFRPWLLPSLLVLLFLLAMTALTFFDAHRHLFPRSSTLRWKRTMMMFLAPTIAIRAKDALSSDLLTPFHPLASALVLCDETERRAFARRVLLDLEHPMKPGYPSEDAQERATIDAFQARLKASLHAMLVNAGENPAALMAPPVKDDPGSLTYCPRCDAQYVIQTGACGHCNDQPLRTFAVSP